MNSLQFIIWILIISTVGGEEDGLYDWDPGSGDDYQMRHYEEYESDDFRPSSRFAQYEYNEDKTLNQIHDHNSALVALFGSEDTVYDLVYGTAYTESYMRLAQVKILLEDTMKDTKEIANLNSSQLDEISNVIEILDGRMDEIITMPRFFGTLVNASHSLLGVLNSSTVFDYLDKVATQVARQQWMCRSGNLDEMWESIVEQSRLLCESIETCPETMSRKRKEAIKGLVQISEAAKRASTADYRGGQIGAKTLLLNTLSEEKHLHFHTRVLGNLGSVRNTVIYILCNSLTLKTLTGLMNDLLTIQPVSSFMAPPLLSNPSDLSTFVEVQQTYLGVIEDLPKEYRINREPPEFAKHLLDSFLNIIDTTLDPQVAELWAQMPLQEANNLLHNILLSNERYVGTVSDLILNNDMSSAENLTMDKSSLTVSMSKVNMQGDSSTVAEFDYEDVHIWTDDINSTFNSSAQSVEVYALRYKSWTNMIQDILREHYNVSNSTEGEESRSNGTKGGRHARSIDDEGAINKIEELVSNKSFVGKGGVISLSTRQSGTKKSIPVTYWMKFSVELLQGDNRNRHCLSCEYLDPETITWESRGCHVVNANDSGITCRCNHTTNFAAFMMPAEIAFEISEEELESLSVMSKLGSVLSVIGLIFALIVFRLVRKLVRNERLTAHAHLSLSLLAVHLVYLFGDVFLKNNLACIASTALAHFFLLASFMWMLVEGIFLYLYVVQVFLRSRIVSYKWMYLVGWGLPIVVVAISAGYGIPHKAYVMTDKSNPQPEKKDFKCPDGSLLFSPENSEVHNDVDDEQKFSRCWLSTDSGMIWSFLAPAIFVLVFNTFIMCKTLQVCIKSFNANAIMRKSNKIYKGGNSQGYMKSGYAPPVSSDFDRSSVVHGNTYDHLHGEICPGQVKPPVVVSTSPSLLQVTTDEEEKEKKGSECSPRDQVSSPENGVPEQPRGSESSPLRSGNEKSETNSANSSPYLSARNSRKFSNPRPSVLYRNSALSSPKLSKPKPSGDLAMSEKRLFFEDAKKAVKGAIVLLPILGVPWICGVFSHLSRVFTFIFVILNSTQGIAIFVVYCICNGEIRRALKRRLAVRKMNRSVDVRVKRTSSTSTAARGFLRMSRRRSTVTTTG